MEFKGIFTLLINIVHSIDSNAIPTNCTTKSRDKMSYIDLFRDIATPHNNSAICTHLDDYKWAFCWSVDFPDNIFIGSIWLPIWKTTLRLFPHILFWSMTFPFLILMTSQSAMNFTFNSISWLKKNYADESWSILWWALQISQATNQVYHSIDPHYQRYDPMGPLYLARPLVLDDPCPIRHWPLPFFTEVAVDFIANSCKIGEKYACFPGKFMYFFLLFLNFWQIQILFT